MRSLGFAVVFAESALLYALDSATLLTALPTACLIGLRCEIRVSQASTSMASPPCKGRPSASQPPKIPCEGPAGLFSPTFAESMLGQTCTPMGTSPRWRAASASNTHLASFRTTHRVRAAVQYAQSALRSTKTAERGDDEPMAAAATADGVAWPPFGPDGVEVPLDEAGGTAIVRKATGQLADHSAALSLIGAGVDATRSWTILTPSEGRPASCKRL